jgi:hypothetical protein
LVVKPRTTACRLSASAGTRAANAST